MSHKFSKRKYGQCLLFLVDLYLRGRVKTIIIRLTGNRSFWPHFLGVTDKGNVIHFTKRKMNADNKDWTPLCLYGRPEIFQKIKLKDAQYCVLIGEFWRSKEYNEV